MSWKESDRSITDYRLKLKAGQRQNKVEECLKLREVTVIQRSPAEIWPWIAVPERFMQWNSNIVFTEAREKFVLQQPFNTQYQLRVEKLYHEDRRRTGLRWGFTGTIDGVRERFFAPELAGDASTSYLALGKRFPPGTKLEVLYNPDVTGDLFQGRTIRVLPRTPDFAALEDRRIYWWVEFCLTPFVALAVVASILQKRKA